jgi:hypothetical protein
MHCISYIYFATNTFTLQEALFNIDTIPSDGINSLQNDEQLDNDDDDDDEEEEGSEGFETLDRRSRYHEAFENAKNSDTQGYISQTIDPSKSSIRTIKDLTAISWAVFCTSDLAHTTEAEEIQHNVFRIQALDMTNVVQRLNLGAALLRMEKKKLKAKLAVAGNTDEKNEEEL